MMLTMRLIDKSQITNAIARLERSLEVSLADGEDPDGYNVGWIEGAIFELRRVAEVETGHLIQVNGDWVCPACETWIDPSELGCGCGRVRPRG